MSGVFISYRREQTASIVDRVHDRLAARFGPGQIFRDVEKIDPFDDFGQRIDEVVGSCSAFLAIMSNRWLIDRNPPGKRPIGVARDWVQREVEVALRRPGMLVIPVLVEGAAVPGELELPYSIRSLATRRAMALSDRSLDADVKRLIDALEPVLGSRALPAGPAPQPPAAVDAPPPAGRWFRRRRSEGP